MSKIKQCTFYHSTLSKWNQLRKRRQHLINFHSFSDCSSQWSRSFINKKSLVISHSQCCCLKITSSTASPQSADLSYPGPMLLSLSACVTVSIHETVINLSRRESSHHWLWCLIVVGISHKNVSLNHNFSSQSIIVVFTNIWTRGSHYQCDHCHLSQINSLSQRLHETLTIHSHFADVKRKLNICYLNSSGVTKHETLCFQHFTTLFGLFEDCCFFDSTFIDEWRKFYHFLHMTCSTLVSWL